MRALPVSLILLWILFPFALSAQPVRITGEVRADQEPFAGARIDLHPAVSTYEDALRQLAGDPPAPLKSTRSQPDGSFKLLAPESGAYRVVVKAEGRLPMELLVVSAVEDVSLPPVELDLFATTTFQALGPDGRPLAGLPLRVELTRDREDLQFLFSWMGARWEPAERQGVTGADGKLTFPRWKLEKLAVLVADPLHGRVDSETGEDSVLVRAKSRPRTLEVLDAQGKPMPGALFRWGTLPVGITGPDGRLAVRLPDGEAPPLQVEGPGGERARVPSKPAEGILVVRLAPPGEITGRVVDSQTRQPIAGALVWSGTPPDWPPVRTAADGTFRLPIPAGSPSELEVAARDYLHESRPEFSGKPVEIVLKRAATLRGQVVDTAGSPVSGVSVEILPSPSGSKMNLFDPSVSTGSDGSFSFQDLLAGGVYKLVVPRSSRYARTEVRVKTAPAGQPSRPARIVLEAGITASGRVIDEAGNPVEGAKVAITGDIPDEVWVATSNAEGAFSIPYVTPGRFRLSAEKAGYSITFGNVAVPEGEPRFEAGEITLRDEATILVRVTDTQGRPVAGAEILGRMEDEGDHPDPMFRDEETGTDGRCLIHGLERGRRYSLVVRHPDHAEARLPGIKAPSDNPVHVELQPFRHLSVRVVGPEGNPVADARVLLFNEFLGRSTERDELQTDAQGEIQMDRMSPVPFELAVSAPGYRNTRWKADEVPQIPVVIKLERAPVLEGRIWDENGEPVSDVPITIAPVGRRDAADEEGRFRIDGLAPGRYTLSAWWGSGRSAEAEVRLESGTTRVDLMFEPAAEVSGRVVDEAGEPVPFAEVRLTSTLEPDLQGKAKTQPDGSFLIRNLERGEFLLTASAHGYGRSLPQVLQVTGSGVEGIEIRLSEQASESPDSLQ